MIIYSAAEASKCLNELVNQFQYQKKLLPSANIISQNNIEKEDVVLFNIFVF